MTNKVVPHENLMDAAMEMAKKIIARAPLAVRLVKAAINRNLHGEEFDYAYEGVGMLFKSDDAKEGITAFMEKRKPDFKGLYIIQADALRGCG